MTCEKCMTCPFRLRWCKLLWTLCWWLPIIWAMKILTAAPENKINNSWQKLTTFLLVLPFYYFLLLIYAIVTQSIQRVSLAQIRSYLFVKSYIHMLKSGFPCLTTRIKRSKITIYQSGHWQKVEWHNFPNIFLTLLLFIIWSDQVLIEVNLSTTPSGCCQSQAPNTSTANNWAQQCNTIWVAAPLMCKPTIPNNGTFSWCKL